MNPSLARQSLEACLRAGVREFCVCPGARNAPWVALLARSRPAIQVWFHFDERSAGFFALGRIKATGRPVAVVTTSGTAAGELLPAAMEAYYSGLPLFLLTADRPRRYRGSGAPQTAEQVGIYGVYAPVALDRADLEQVDLGEAHPATPVHLNVCFEEPLYPAETEGALLIPPSPASSSEPMPASNLAQTFADLCGSFFRGCARPIAIVGALSRRERPAVAVFLLRHGIPAYFEALSGLREDPALGEIRIHNADRLLVRAGVAGYPVDGVLRIGSIPTHRIWRDLEDSTLPILNLGPLPFSGLGRATRSCSGNIPEMLGNPIPGPSPHPSSSGARTWLDQDRARAHAVMELLREEPASEPGLIHALSRLIPSGAQVYLGNSLPIREWDLAADLQSRGFECHASRGLNGIDGQVSTFLGLCQPGQTHWAILGDLTALYDLQGPWITHQLPPAHFGLAIINNGGGKIFERMFPMPEFQNRHSIEFEAWARLWGWRHERWEAGSTVPIRIESDVSTTPRMLECVPDELATVRFWKRYAEL